MNEIEEYLLMIFLEDLGHWDEYLFEWCSRFSERWKIFKQEELGRTIPNEFEFYISDIGIDNLRAGFSPTIYPTKCEVFKNKIKITVVNE